MNSLSPERAPLISVIMPAFNVENTIGAAISSVLCTDYPQLEVIVCDDGSQDATVAIAEAHTRSSVPGRRVVVLQQANGGVSAARNTAIEVARGEFFALCDSDDILLAPHLSAAMSVLEKMRATGASRALVDCNAYLLTPGGVHPSRRLLKDRLPPADQQREAILDHNFVSYFTLFPRSLFEEVGTFSESLRTAEDWDMWARAIYAGWRVVRQERPHALYRWRGGSLSTGRDQMYSSEDEVIRRLVDSGRMDASEYARALRRLEAGSPLAMGSEAEQALREGDLARARHLYATAAQLLPRQRSVRAKAVIARVPGGGYWLRRRQAVIDERIGFQDEIRR